MEDAQLQGKQAAESALVPARNTILAKNDVTLTESDGVVVEVSFADKNIVSLMYRV